MEGLNQAHSPGHIQPHTQTPQGSTGQDGVAMLMLCSL